MTRLAVRQAQQARQLRGQIAARLEQGDSLDGVERELIEPSRLSEEQQAALWLYGWSLPKLARRRAALPYLDSLGREDPQPATAAPSYLAGD